ncbi:hypothetical protein GWN42_20425 [candidate division KSB1 bacterium]|nr:hypothetical protein [candidate division KSB1 bacterium]NIR71232.1 hypothetical protein [candidate division KSB1 bacterium]NIS26314.1 hypothetical protein [candidate division KSB1 bacterium]NIU26984.1 hypothetical protein [candidate division KSB1 bacterium]NIV95089.1 hypothetical protein [candidate division KSB1 bacterium]
MSKETKQFTTIKIWIETRRKLRQIAALTDRNMVEVIDDLATKDLKRLQKGK